MNESGQNRSDTLAEAKSEPIPEIVFQGATTPIPKLAEYTLTQDVHFAAPLVQTGPEFLFTGSILKSTDGRLYFIPSGKFDDLEIGHFAPPSGE